MICLTWNRSINYKYKALEIEESNKVTKETFDSTMAVVEEIINDIFTRYTIMNTELKDDLYMNEDMIHDMMFNVLKESYLCMSPQLMDKLTTIYSSDYVDDIIAKKVQMLTMSYVIQVNGTYKK